MAHPSGSGPECEHPRSRIGLNGFTRPTRGLGDRYEFVAGIKTARGGKWTHLQVGNILARTSQVETRKLSQNDAKRKSPPE
jgi:hypothetical protein